MSQLPSPRGRVTVLCAFAILAVALTPLFTSPTAAIETSSGITVSGR